VAAEQAAGQRAQRQRPPDQDLHAGVHAAPEPVRGEGLAQAERAHAEQRDPERQQRLAGGEPQQGGGQGRGREGQAGAAGRLHQLRRRQRPARAEAAGRPRRQGRAEQAGDPGGREDQAERGRPEAELPGHVEPVGGELDLGGEAEAGAGDRDRAQRPGAEHEPEPLAELAPQSRRSGGGSGTGLGGADAPHRQRRDQERAGVHGDRDRRGEQLQGERGQALAADLRDRLAQLQLGVALDEVSWPDQRRQVGLAGDIEQQRDRAEQQRDEKELRDSQHAEHRSDRYRAEQRRPDQVGRDQDRSAPDPVDPGSRRQSDEQFRSHSGRPQQAHLEGGRMEGDGGRDRQAEVADLRAEERDGLPGPQPAETSAMHG
jgi:hypothetical protein